MWFTFEFVQIVKTILISFITISKSIIIEFGPTWVLVGRIFCENGCDADRLTCEKCKFHLSYLCCNFLKMISMIVLESDVS